MEIINKNGDMNFMTFIVCLVFSFLAFKNGENTTGFIVLVIAIINLIFAMLIKIKNKKDQQI